MWNFTTKLSECEESEALFSGDDVAGLVENYSE